MFIVLLKFSEGKSKASEFMEGHNQWIKRGFDEGIFVLAGSLVPGVGGVIVAQGVNGVEIAKRVNEDPFVIENVVTAEVLEVDPKKVDDRLTFLLG